MFKYLKENISIVVYAIWPIIKCKVLIQRFFDPAKVSGSYRAYITLLILPKLHDGGGLLKG